MLNAFNPDGFLLQGEIDYLNCLKLQHIRLEELFKRDDDHWNRHVQDARKDAEKVFEDLYAIFEESQKKMQAVLMKQTKRAPEYKFTLRKLP